jgi:sugar lactone lactonase YvrE
VPAAPHAASSRDEAVTHQDYSAVACTEHQSMLGEGLRWDAYRCELLRVDILAGRVHRDLIDPSGRLLPIAVYEVPGTVGAVTPVAHDCGWLLAAERGFQYLRHDGSVVAIRDVAKEGTRMNDAACDPRGRLWAGALARDFRVGGGTLFCLRGDGRCRAVLDGLTIPNGIGWSPDGRTMYLADSGRRVVIAFDYDAVNGEISSDRVLVALDEGEGTPDGLTVDARGHLWVAIYGGGRVNRYRPNGQLCESIVIPAEQVTSCAFAGLGMNRLYVTTGTEGWSDDQRQADPGAGLVYRFDTGSWGIAAQPFVPDPVWWGDVAGVRKIPPGFHTAA